MSCALCAVPLTAMRRQNYPFVPQTVDFLSEYVSRARELGVRTKFYYTLHELSNRAAEIFPLLSLQGEVYLDLPDSPWTTPYLACCCHTYDCHGGDVWLHQHVAKAYTPCWQEPLSNGEMDGALCDIGTSRFFNYYVNGLDWSIRRAPHIDGVYYVRRGP